MEQIELNKEKEVLMDRIKDRYCSNVKLYKWAMIFSMVFVALLSVVAMCLEGILKESNTMILLVLLAITYYMSTTFGNKIESLTEPRELLHEYDKYNRQCWVTVTVLFIAYLLSFAFLRQEPIIAAIMAGVTVLLVLVLWLLGLTKDKNIERLRELVEQEK